MKCMEKIEVWPLFVKDLKPNGLIAFVYTASEMGGEKTTIPIKCASLRIDFICAMAVYNFCVVKASGY